LATALRDCGLNSFMICGVATEIGIDPTVRHGTDLGFIPIVIENACGHGHKEASDRAIENIRYMGDAFVTSVEQLRPDAAFNIERTNIGAPDGAAWSPVRLCDKR